MKIIGNSWDKILKDEFEKTYFKELQKFIRDEREKYTVYPLEKDVFNALKYTDYNNVKAVIIGQDPYHGENQAHGLSFSVPCGEKIPPSLKNIFKELKKDLSIETRDNGNLENWAKEGVLLLNAVLTVRAGEANSHKKKGWEKFTDSIISKLNQREKPIVFILWGNNAKAKKDLIDENKHLILEGAHPSPLSASRGFFEGSYFSKTNLFLNDIGEKSINWEI